MPLLTRMTSLLPQDRPSAAECARELRAPAPEPTLVVAEGPVVDQPHAPTIPAPGPRPGTGTGSAPQPRRTGLGAAGALLALYAVSCFLRAYSAGGDGQSVWSVRWGTLVCFVQSLVKATGHDFATWDALARGAVASLLAFFGLLATLLSLAGLLPGAGPLPRRTGYAGAAVAVIALAWQATLDPPWYTPHFAMPTSTGMWFFYAVTALAVTEFGRRDLLARRAAARP